MKKLLFIFAMAGFAAFDIAKAQTAMPDTATKHFIMQAAIGGLQEVTDGQLAAQKAVSAEVKSYGRQMVTDHTQAQAKLMQLVKAKGYQLPPQVNASVPDLMLQRASGKDFDRVYVHMMVPDHRKTVYLFQNYAVSGKDPELKAFAQQQLPVLKRHLAMATALDNKMKTQPAK